MNAVANFFLAIAAYFGWAKLREEEKNSADIKENELARQRQEQADRVNREIELASKGDKKAQETLRKEWSEN